MKRGNMGSLAKFPAQLHLHPKCIFSPCYRYPYLLDDTERCLGFTNMLPIGGALMILTCKLERICLLSFQGFSQCSAFLSLASELLHKLQNPVFILPLLTLLSRTKGIILCSLSTFPKYFRESSSHHRYSRQLTH